MHRRHLCPRPSACVLILLLVASAGIALPALAEVSARANAAMIQVLGERIGQARRASSDISVHVMDVSTGEEVYGYRADEQQILASNTKLFTTAAALDLLTPDFEYDTPILIRGAVYGGVLGGDLAVVGSGDPSISGRFYGGDPLYIFRAWGRSLRERGVERVKGDLYLARGLFEKETVHPDWPADQLARWYEAPVDALSFSDNCVQVRVLPGPKKGGAALVELVPQVDVVRLVNRVTTSATRKAHRILIQREPGSQEIVVSGQIWSGSGPHDAWVTVPDPSEYFGSALRLALVQEGVTVEGETRIVDGLPGDVWERVASARTDLASTLAVINQKSQNFYAESLIKLLGARSGGEGSWRQGVKTVLDFLARAGIVGVELADGSGMSRGNRATPRHLTALLRHMYHRPEAERYMTSLAAAGSSEGTWGRHFRQAPYNGNVYAKTGTLSGVSSLSGYARAVSGRVYAFSILCNQTGSVWRARQAQDAVVRALVDFG